MIKWFVFLVCKSKRTEAYKNLFWFSQYKLVEPYRVKDHEFPMFPYPSIFTILVIYQHMSYQ